MGTKTVDKSIKWQIIGLKKVGELSNVQIGKIVGVSEKCVRTTWKNYADSGDVADKSRSGRPKKFSEHVESYVVRIARKNPRFSTLDISRSVNEAKDKVISKMTVSRILRRNNLKSYTALRKPLLRPLDRIRRRKWCRERILWQDQDWAKVIFSDESNFEVFNRKNRVLVRRLDSQKFESRMCVPRIQGGGGSVGIWGCFSSKGTGVSNIYTGRINQFIFMDVLEECLKPSVEILQSEVPDWKYQQDGAPAHTAKTVKEYFAANDIEVIPWPARSPDLNPIENIWAYMDNQLSKYQVTSLTHLKQCLHDEWLKVPTKMCENLINSMKKRVRACYYAKGGYFKY